MRRQTHEYKNLCLVRQAGREGYSPIVDGLNKTSGTLNRSLQRYNSCSSSFSGCGALYGADGSTGGGEAGGGVRPERT